MRLHLRGLFVGCVILLFVLFMMFFYNVNDSPLVKKRVMKAEDIENRIHELEEKMDNQLTESNKLLHMVVKRLKKKNDFGVKIVDLDWNSKAGLEQKYEDIDASKVQESVLPVLVIACDRVTVKRCLENLIKFRPSKETFPMIVSQDCGHNATYQVIKSFTDQDPTITVVQQPDLSEIPLDRTKIKFKGYYKIARHFKFALNHVFKTLGHEAVIIVEDDLDISPDFFEYFQGTYPLLLKDPSLWCVSAWNDNGKKQLVDLSRPELLHRTDFFPGLGWLLRSGSWSELEPKWPQAFFDDWLRDPVNTRGRACIRPEISRTYSFGKAGVSKGLFFDNHLRYIVLNREYVEFTKRDLTYLLKDKYDHTFTTFVYSLPEVTADEVMAGGVQHPSVRVPYSNPKTFHRAAKKLGLMDDFRVTAYEVMAGGVQHPSFRVPYSNPKTFHKAAKKLGLMDDFRSGIPRTAYRGIVQCTVKDRRVYLAPDFIWTHYDRSWE